MLEPPLLYIIVIYIGEIFSSEIYDGKDVCLELLDLAESAEYVKTGLAVDMKNWHSRYILMLCKKRYRNCL